MTRPETILLTSTVGQIARCVPADIPCTSPYYDRLAALFERMNFVKTGSQEHAYLLQQIAEMERRARRRLETDAYLKLITQ